MNEITPNEELIKMVKDGQFFHFCIAFALNKGFKDTIKEKKDVKFSVGEYDVVFDYNSMCFVMGHKIYFARIITAYYNQVFFIGETEEEVIKELLTELEREINLTV